MKEMQNNVAKRLLNVSELSHYTSIPVGTLYVMISKKTLPGVVKIGKSVRVEKSAIDEWLSSLRPESIPTPNNA